MDFSALDQAWQTFQQTLGNVKNFFDTGPELPFKSPIPKRDVLTHSLPAGVMSPIPEKDIILHPIGPSAFQQATEQVQQEIQQKMQQAKQNTSALRKFFDIGTTQSFSIQQPKMDVQVIPQVLTAQTAIPSITPQPTIFKYQDAVNQATQQTGITNEQFHLLRAGENKAENPEAVNDNYNGTIDVGLYQINVNSQNTAEIERLKDPVYNTLRAGQIFQQRISILKDPVLAIASYNLGAGGAVLRPVDALKRAQWVYYNAGIPMPETEFTKNPLVFVRKNMDYYKQIGLFR